MTATDPAAALYRASYAKEAARDYAGALRAMTEVGDLDEERQDYVFHLRRAWLLYEAGHLPEAEGAYRKAASLEPKAVEPRLGQSLALTAMRRWHDAEQALTAALALAPTDFTALSRMAFVLYQAGDFARAETYYRKALVLFPANADMRCGLGWSLLKQHKMPAACTELSRVLSFAPDHAAAKEGMSKCR
jgi:tetratricopeptide (TPR) repeat protein